MTILNQAKLLESKYNWITFSCKLWYSKGKKQFNPPKDWSNFTKAIPLENRVNPDHNCLCIITGDSSGIFLVDIDNRDHWKILLEENHQEEPVTVSASSGNNGLHLYFKYTSTLAHIKSSSKIIPGKDIDVRSNGGMIIAPPTKAQDFEVTKEYKWINQPDSVPLAEVPEWLMKVLSPKSKKLPKSRDHQATGSVDEPNFTFPEELKDFILSKFSIYPDDIDTIKYYNDSDTYIIGTKEKKCPFVKRAHNSNHQYLTINCKTHQISRKCHSGECKDSEFGTCQIPDDIWAIIRPENAVSGELIKAAVADTKDHLNTIFDGNENMEIQVLEDKSLGGRMDSFVTRGIGTCPACRRGRLISSTTHEGTSVMCSECPFRFPGNGTRLPFDVHKYAGLTQYMQVTFNIGNINIYNAPQEETTIGWNEFVEDNIHISEDANLNNLILASLAGTHMRVADLAFQFLGERLVYCTVQNKWYAWGPHLWRDINSEEVHTLLRQSQVTACLTKAKRVYEQSNVKLKDRKVSQIQKVITQLENNGYQNSVIEQLKIQCSRSKKDFFDKLDKNTKLFGFTNGVYDLNRHEFREGSPADYVSMSCGFEWDETKMNDESIIQEVNDFYFKVFPDHDVGKCFLLVCGSALEGYTGNQVLYFGHGSGGNGKGIIGNLLLSVFGDYGGTLQASFLTGKTPDANSPTPALTSMLGKRLIITQEIDPGATLNVPLFKSLTGQDKMPYRPLYGEIREFVPTSQTLFMCNQLPKFSGEDAAMKRRIETFPFISTFKDAEDGPPNPEKHHYIKDKTLTDKISGWKWVFLKFLLEGHKAFKAEGITIATAMKALKLRYVAENDYWNALKDDLFQPCDEGGLPSASVKAKVIEWMNKYKMTTPRPFELQKQIDIMLNGSEFETSNDRRYVDINGKQRHGYPRWKFRTEDDAQNT